MSQDYGIDNEGTGFDFDDEEDIEKVFNRVSQAADPGEDNDDSHLAYVYDNQSNDEYTEEKDDTPSSISTVDEHVEFEAPVEADDSRSNNSWEVVNQDDSSQLVHEVPTYDDSIDAASDDNYEAHEEFIVDDSTSANESEENISHETLSPENRRVYNSDSSYAGEGDLPETQPKRYGTHSSGTPVESYSASTPSPTPQDNVAPLTTPVASSRRFNIPTEKEDIAHAERVIKIIDVYRGLSNQNVVAQLIYNENEVDHKDEASLVVKALRADPVLSEMMTALREAALEKDRVERVFYILRLERHLLNYLGDFLTTIVGAEFTDKNDQIGYSKQIETVIEGLDSKIVQIVADAQSVLAAAHE